MPTLLQQWLCDQATVDNRESGMFFYRWNAGFYAAGMFKVLKLDSQIVQTWRLSSEPVESTLTVTLTAGDGATTVEISHDVSESAVDWAASLDHLKYLLEVGFDQRIMTRPMLGIYPSNLGEERAAKLGLTGIKGVHIDNVIEGMGAAAVLQRGDVLMSIGGVEVTDFASIQKAVAPFKGGDTAPVEYYRAGQKHSADILLSKRPLLELPVTPSALAEELRSNLEEVSAELDALVAGVPDDIMSRRPDPTEWSANENVAHLIHTTRNNQNWLFNMAGGDDSVLWMDNNDLHLIASTSVYQSAADLVAEFKRSERALIAQAEAIPAVLANNKALMNYIGQNLTNEHIHSREHFEQMRRTLEQVQQPTA